MESNIEQVERIRLIATQDISIFENTPIYSVFVMRKMAAEKLSFMFFHGIGDELQEFLNIINLHSDTIKKYLLL